MQAFKRLSVAVFKCVIFEIEVIFSCLYLGIMYSIDNENEEF